MVRVRSYTKKDGTKVSRHSRTVNSGDSVSSAVSAARSGKESYSSMYKGFKIKLDKIKRRYFDGYEVTISDASGNVVHKQRADINFGVYGDKSLEASLEATKKYIDNNLVGVKIDKVKKGDIFSTSWGYDQTNYDYIIVTQVSPSGKTVKARRAMHEDVGYSGQAYIQKPVAKPFGDTFQLKVKYRKGEPELIGSYPFSGDGTGYRRRGFFTKVDPGETFYETDPVFGH